MLKSDPARFSFAMGGQDGHRFPVPLKNYDESLAVLRRGLDAAGIGDIEKLHAFRRLDQFTRNIEQSHHPEAHFAEVLAHEHVLSASIGGRTVFDDRRRRRESAGTPQLSLFE